jgi:hypothetical protein
MSQCQAGIVGGALHFEGVSSEETCFLKALRSTQAASSFSYSCEGWHRVRLPSNSSRMSPSRSYCSCCLQHATDRRQFTSGGYRQQSSQVRRLF